MPKSSVELVKPVMSLRALRMCLLTYATQMAEELYDGDFYGYRHGAILHSVPSLSFCAAPKIMQLLILLNVGEQVPCMVFMISSALMRSQ